MKRLNRISRQKRLTLRAHLATYQGYSQLINEVFKHLTAAGIYVSIRPIAIDEQWGKTSAIPAEMRAQIVNCRQPEGWELLISNPSTPPTPSRKTILWTMYESTQMPDQYVSLLNRCEHVITPCKWNTTHFKANGVVRPISTIPLGYDPLIFAPSQPPQRGPLVIAVAGRTRHCAKRKNVDGAIDAFLKAFPPGVDDVRLHVKLHPDDKIADVKDERIKVVREHYEPYQVAQWLAACHVFLTLSRAEGYGLWPLQALACGRPVIGCRHSGQADFLTADNAFIVPHREVDAQSGESNVTYMGQWAEPAMMSAVKILQNIHANRKQVPKITSADCAESIKHLTWESSAKKLMAVLDRLGVWK